MSILQAQQLGISYGAFDLFKGISLTVANDAKIGLIGPNGVGKVHHHDDSGRVTHPHHRSGQYG